MKTIYNSKILMLWLAVIIVACNRDMDMGIASYPTEPTVFDDGFSSGLQYSAFGNSNVSAFEVDEEVRYQGESSMRFDVPNNGNPKGSYAGGVFSTEMGRDLTGYDALTFWLKASQSATIDLLGFGNDLAESTYQASISDLLVDTKWTKIVIPIPDPSKLVSEKGMFFYSDAPDNEKGYTFWIDELKFEKLGTIAHQEASILNGEEQTIQLVSGIDTQIQNLSASFNLPIGVNQAVTLTNAYFDFSSSDTNVATVDANGLVTAIGSGSALITATLAGSQADGSLSVSSVGELTMAPTPTVDEAVVISLFSNSYTNVAVDSFNPFWGGSTTQISEFSVEGNDVILYTALNFVGIGFESNTINTSNMTNLHLDVLTSDATPPLDLTVEIVDFGDNNVFDQEGDDTKISSTTTLTSGEWVGVDINLLDLTNRSNVAQIVLSGGENLTNLFVDNIYFYTSGIVQPPTTPEEVAAEPTQLQSDVLSIYSDSYTNLSGTNLNPDWGQQTVFSEETIDGNSFIKLSSFNYQGTMFELSQDLSELEFLHLDFWSADATTFNVYLISSGPVETPYTLEVPTSGWSSVDIPLTAFSSIVDLSDVIQMKYDGGGGMETVYLDNIYFYTESGSSSSAPTQAAPVPEQTEDGVLSIYSNSYTNLSGTNLNPDWGQQTVFSEETIDGNNFIKLTSFNYQGTMFELSQDLSELEFLHLDFWSADATTFSVYLISSGPVETLYTLEVPTSGWSSVDIPLTSFSSIVDLSDVIQMKYDGGIGEETIYLDNIYFY